MGNDFVRLEFAYAYEDFHTRMNWRQLFSWVDVAGWLLVVGMAVGVFWVFGEKMDRARFGKALNLSELRAILPYFSVGALAYLFWRFGHGGKSAWEKANRAEVMVVTMSGDGIVWERAASRTEVKWHAYQKWEETEKGIVLRSELHSVLLPRRVMTEQQAEVLRKMFRENISEVRGFEVLPAERRKMEEKSDE